MATIDTLGALIDEGYRLAIYCGNPFCRHNADLDLHALVEKLGREFVTVGKPNPLAAKMKCSVCGGKDLGLILQPRTGYTDAPPNAVIPVATIAPEDRPHVKARRSRRRVRL